MTLLFLYDSSWDWGLLKLLPRAEFLSLPVNCGFSRMFLGVLVTLVWQKVFHNLSVSSVECHLTSLLHLLREFCVVYPSICLKKKIKFWTDLDFRGPLLSWLDWIFFQIPGGFSSFQRSKSRVLIIISLQCCITLCYSCLIILWHNMWGNYLLDRGFSFSFFLFFLLLNSPCCLHIFAIKIFRHGNFTIFTDKFCCC